MKKTAAICWVIVWLCLIFEAPAAGQGPAPRREAEQLVQEALGREPYGLAAERRDLVERAIKLAPQLASARWADGQARVRDRWARHSDLDSPEVRRSYETRRAAVDPTPEGLWRLVQWCVRQGLHGRARAHALQVMEMAPTHKGARRVLASTQPAQRHGFWLTEAQARESLRQWTAELKKVAKIRERSSSEAWARLERIDDPGAAPAIELIYGEDERLSYVAIDLLARLPGTQPSLSLARLATLGRNAQVREAAAAQLRQRPLEGFVPALLAELSDPIEVRLEAASVRHKIKSRQVFIRESQNEKHVVVLDEEFVHQPSPAVVFVQQAIGPGTPSVGRAQAQGAIEMAYRSETVRQLLEFRRRVAWNWQARAGTVQLQNSRIQALNQRLMSALTTTSGESFSTPEQWWSWWAAQQERTEGEKHVAYDYRSDRSKLTTKSIPKKIVVRRTSCFVAGTPVLTEAGVRPIESVRVGDQVLTQEADSGELRLRTVLGTTLRPPHPTCRIRLTSGRQIQATGGHPLWVSGEGWVLVKNLKSGMQLHTVRGAVGIAEVTLESARPTHNLIVDQSHTYFVGHDHVLCHDNAQHYDEAWDVPGLRPVSASR